MTLPFGERRTGVRNDPAFLIALMVVVGFFAIALLAILRDIPKDSQNIVQQIIAIVSMIMSAMAGYFYGASKTSTDLQKTAATATALNQTALTDIAKKTAGIEPVPAPAVAPLPAADVTVNAAGDVKVEGQPKGTTS